MDTKDMTMTRRATSRPEPEASRWKYSRTVFRRTFGCGGRGQGFEARAVKIETARPDGSSQRFTMVDRSGYMELIEEIPEPHAFTANLSIGGESYAVEFVEHEHGKATMSRQ